MDLSDSPLAGYEPDGKASESPGIFPIFARFGDTVERTLASNYQQLPLFVPVVLAAGVVFWFAWGADGFWPATAVAGFGVIGALRLEKTSLRWAAMVGFALLIFVGFMLIAARAYNLDQPRLERPWFGRLYAHVEKVEAKAALGKEYLYLNTQSRQNLPSRVRVARDLEPDRAPVVTGDMIIVRARLMPPSPPAIPGAYDFSERAYFMGVGATGTALGEVRVIEKGLKFGNSQFLQQPLSTLVQRRISGDAGAIAATLASGDRGAISATADEWMRGSGMAHLLSISGLHVTALVGAIYVLVARLLALSPYIALRYSVPMIAAIFGAMGAVFYTWLTGAEVPTIRSCIAALLVLAALVAGRDPLSMRLLAIGATFVIVFWPEAIMGPSFQLSFAAVAAIIALHDMPFLRRWREEAQQGSWLQKMRHNTLSLFLTGLLVEITLSPIALYHFQESGLYGALANMVAIPLTTFVIMPAIALSLALDWTGLAGPLWWLTSVPLNGLLSIAELAATAPGAKVMVPAFSPWGFGLFAIGICVVYLLTSRLRWFGLAPILAGLAIMMSSSVPDLLIDSNGHHLALRGRNGAAYFLHTGQGEFVRDMMQEQLGMQQGLLPIEQYEWARCNDDICHIAIASTDTNPPLHVLVTRSNRYLKYQSLISACKAVDIAISDRSLPKGCTPKWLKIDRYSLRKTGGLAIFAHDRRIKSVADDQAHLPWSVYRR